ncbi:MAG: SOS response-associated peptidase [Gammaproteobacteria bacterium]
MCGRFSLWSDKNKILGHYGLSDAPDFTSSYNIPPSFDIPIVRDREGRELVNVHWGFIPHWAKDKKLQPINARADTVAKKPMFRDAFKHRRCLIPANGYFEWKVENGRKQPYFIKVKDAELFSFAGIWSHWDSPDKTIESCAIITTDANPDTAKIHDRMPVIINPEDYDLWLTEGGEDLLRPYPGKMDAWLVSTRVNSPKNQGLDLIQRI